MKQTEDNTSKYDIDVSLLRITICSCTASETARLSYE